MNRLDGRPVKARKRPVARDRYATARIVVSLLFMLGAAGTVRLHFQLSPPDPFQSAPEAYLAGASCGLWTGWAIVGLRLDRSLASAGMSALSAVAAAGMMFGLLAGAKAVVDSYRFMGFDTVQELLIFLLEKASQTSLAVFGSQTCLLAAGGAMLIAMMGAALHRRFDTPEPVLL